MTVVLPLNYDLSDRDLSPLVEANLFALFRSMTAALPGSELVESEKLCHHLAFPGNPMFKSIWRTRLPEDEVNDAIEQTIAWYRERHAPYACWWTGASTQPVTLDEKLAAHGLEQRYETAPGMVLDRHTLSDDERSPEGFTLVQAMDAKMLDEWQELFQQIYGRSPSGQAWVDATLSIGAENAPWQLYTGYLHGKPAATTLIFKGAGVLGLFCIGTVPAARGKGIGRAITLLPLLESPEYRYAVLFASAMGLPMYLKLGFREMSCRFGRYLWFNR